MSPSIVVKAESSISIVSQEETAPNGDESDSNELIKEQKMKKLSSVDDSIIDEVIERQIQLLESPAAKTTTPTEQTPSLVEASMTGKKDIDTPPLPSSRTTKPLTPSHRNDSDDSSTIQEFRRQPKSAEEEQRLSEKYGALPLPDRAFRILLDLGMIEDTI